jgi:hypothetical protein
VADFDCWHMDKAYRYRAIQTVDPVVELVSIWAMSRHSEDLDWRDWNALAKGAQERDDAIVRRS